MISSAGGREQAAPAGGLHSLDGEHAAHCRADPADPVPGELRQVYSQRARLSLCQVKRRRRIFSLCNKFWHLAVFFSFFSYICTHREPHCSHFFKTHLDVCVDVQ